MVNSQKKVAVALSGGVDSSVTALLLMRQGYEVVGLTGKMVNSPTMDLVCQNAKRVADKLGIKHYIYDATEIFHKNVISYFETSYLHGSTPNPCIMCNKFIKWGILFDYALNELGADFYATGHYAKIKSENGIFKLYPASDEHKDQLYFLYKLTQEHLSHTLFPLSDFSKSDVRKMAIDFDLPPKDSKESQDICFIEKPNTTKKYLVETFGIQKGDFIEIGSNKKLGEHDGSFLYTIGQRKGIGISAPYPLYVVGIDADRNVVYLGKDIDTFKCGLSLENLNFTYPIEMSEFDAMVKIRYNMRAKKAKCKIHNENIQIEFYEPVNSVTAGQAGVLYDINDGHLIGGGTIV